LDADGKTALHNACENNKLDAARFLLDSGANVNAKTSPDDDGVGFAGMTDVWDVTPLHFAVEVFDYVDMVRLLMDRGANVHSKDSEGRTALYVASSSQHQLGVIQLLLDRGANINDATNDGETPLYHALKWILMDLGWCFGTHAKNRSKAMECCVPDQSLKLVDLLLAHGAVLPSHAASIDVYANDSRCNDWYPSSKLFSLAMSMIDSQLTQHRNQVQNTNSNKLSAPATIPAHVLFAPIQETFATAYLI
jgi:ankyrin repeat protein